MAILSKEDLKQIAGKGMTEAQVNAQLEQFKTGFPYLRLEAAQVSAVLAVSASWPMVWLIIF